jgi:hypothetical protein
LLFEDENAPSKWYIITDQENIGLDKTPKDLIRNAASLHKTLEDANAALEELKRNNPDNIKYVIYGFPGQAN